MLNKGFSLIEVLIAIALVAVILPGVVTLMSFGSFTSQQGETFTGAYSLAQKEMEKLYSLKKTNWSSLAPGGPTCSSIPSTIFTKCITVTTINSGEKKVLMQITWTERGSVQSVAIESLVANI